LRLVDILKITETQARVLRAIAYYEVKSNQKGATQYTCSNKVSKKYRVSGSTFNDSIKKLQKGNVIIERNPEFESEKIPQYNQKTVKNPESQSRNTVV